MIFKKIKISTTYLQSSVTQIQIKFDEIEENYCERPN